MFPTSPNAQIKKKQHSRRTRKNKSDIFLGQLQASNISQVWGYAGGTSASPRESY